jgi:hypothetical protein
LPLASTVAPIILALAAVCLGFTGCGRVDEIQHYQALKLRQPDPPKVELPPPVDRILAAIVLRKPDGPGGEPPAEAWYFKLAGPVEAVNTQADAFDQFISSIHFVDRRPAYDAPPDWKPQGEGPMRYETFEIPSGGEKPLELTVTTLPRGEQEESEFEQANINRWRGQLSLPASSTEDADPVRRLSLPGATAAVVSLVGKLKPTGMGPQVAPFSGAGDGK